MDDRRTRSRAVVRAVLDVLNKYDLSGVQPGTSDGAPVGEYQNEALPIAGLLMNRGNVGRSDVAAVWTKSFGDDLRGISDDVWAGLLGELNAVGEMEAPGS